MKYYRVKKNTFLWQPGAILKDQDKGHYVAIEDIWDKVPGHSEYISAKVVESKENEEFFERVYPDTIAGKIFHTKDQLAELYTSKFKG